MCRKSAPLGIRLDFQFDGSFDQLAFVQDDGGRNLVFVTGSNVLHVNVIDNVGLGTSGCQTKGGTCVGACVDRHLQGFARFDVNCFGAVAAVNEIVHKETGEIAVLEIPRTQIVIIKRTEGTTSWSLDE
jgi:hypothetical protein